MLVLAAEGLPALDLDDMAEGFICESWSLGPPAVRDVVVDRTLASGTIDWTQFIGSRALTMTVVCFPAKGLTTQGQIDRLTAYCSPALRPTLTWRVDTDPERMVTMRANPGLDMEWSSSSYAWRRVGLSFVVPDGVKWAAVASSALIIPTGGEEDGRSYNEYEITTPYVPLNLIGNDNQASIESGSTVPAGNLGNGSWTIWGGAQTVARDPAVARHGTSSLVLARTAAAAAQGTPTVSGGTALNRFPVEQGHVYQVQASCFVEAAAADKRFQISGDVRDATPVSIGTWVRSMNSPGGAWEDRVTSFLVPPGGMDTYLLFTAWPEANTGKAWLDRVALYDEGVYEWALPSLSGGRNLLTDQQASIEAGPTTPAWNAFPGWRGSTSSVPIYRATTESVHGASSLAIDKVGATGTSRVVLADDTGAAVRVPVQAGRRYRFAAWMRRSGLAGATNHTLVVSVQDAAGAFVADLAVNASVPVNDTWWPVYSEVQIPVNGATVGLYIDVGVVAQGVPALMDSVWFGPAPDPMAFELPSEADPGTGTGEWGRGYDRSYPSSAPVNVAVINAGSATVGWEADITGPCVNPRLYNDTTGQGLIFSLTLSATDVLHIDGANHVVLLNGSPRYDKLNVALSRWWLLQPGTNHIRFRPDSASPGCVAEIHWRPGWV